MTTNHRLEICTKEAQRSGRRCEAHECYRPTYTIGRYCSYHRSRYRRTGHPDGKRLLKRELQPYLKMADAFLIQHHTNPSKLKAERWLVQLFEFARDQAIKTPFPKQEQLAWRWLSVIGDVSGVDVLRITLAHFIMREDRPLRFRDDQHFNFCLVRALLLRAKAVHYTQRPSFPAMRSLGLTLSRCLALFCMAAAEVALRESYQIK